jgi:hypothetical protein
MKNAELNVIQRINKKIKESRKSKATIKMPEYIPIEKITVTRFFKRVPSQNVK